MERADKESLPQQRYFLRELCVSVKWVGVDFSERGANTLRPLFGSQELRLGALLSATID